MQLVEQRFAIGEQIFDGGTLTLSSADAHTRLPLKAAQVLIVLAEHVGHTVTRDTLLDRVWPDQFRTPDVLTQVIVELRRALHGGASVLVTVPKVGYRLQAEVTRLGTEMTSADAAPVADTLDLKPQLAPVEAAELIAPAPGQEHPPPATGPKSSWASVFWVAVVSLAMIGLWHWSRLPSTKTNTESSSILPAPAIEILSADPASERWPALSPDGSRVAYSVLRSNGHREVVVQIPGSSAQTPLLSDATADQAHPVWAPDGREVAFLSFSGQDCVVRAVAAMGGASRVLRNCIPSVISWFQWPTPDTLYTTYMTPDSPGLRIHRQWLNSDRDEVLQYPRRENDHDSEPKLSPTGRYLAFRRGRRFSNLMLLDQQSGQLQEVTAAASWLTGHTWLGDEGLLIYATDAYGPSELVAFDPATSRRQRLSVAPARHPSAATGTRMLAYEWPRQQTQLWSFQLHGEDDGLPVLPPSTGSDRAAQFSPDGASLAFVSNRSGADQLWIVRGQTAAQQLSQLQGQRVREVAWHPDGKSLLIVTSSAERWDALALDVATRREQPVQGIPGSIRSLHGSRTAGRLLAITEIDGALHLLVLDRDQDRWTTTRQLLGGNRVAEAADGRLLLTLEGLPGLYQLRPEDAEPVLLSDRINLVNQTSWTIADDRVWFIQWTSPPTLRTLDENGETSIVRELRRGAQAAPLVPEIAIANGRLVMTAMNQDQTDIALLRW